MDINYSKIKMNNDENDTHEVANELLNGVVYKLKCNDPNIKEFYIGSSVNMKQRIANHKSDCNNTNSIGYNFKVYKFIRNNGGFENWEFETLLEVEVISKKELRLKYERPYQLELLPQLNSQLEGRTIEEWYEDNKEEILKKQKKWREDNKETILEYHKERYEKNKETIKEKYENNKEEIAKKNKERYENNKEEIAKKRKENYEDHKEEILKKQKIYNEKHKVEILEKQREKFKCDCGGKYTKSNKTKHLNSKKHKDYIESLNKN